MPGDKLAEELEVVRMDLTDVLLRKVFPFLDSADLCRAAAVCKRWRAASAHEGLWMRLNFEKSKISVEQFEDVCRRYPNATEVNISGAPKMHLLAEKAALLLRNLETLTLGKPPTEAESPIAIGLRLRDIFSHALADCNTLRTLNVTHTLLGDLNQDFPINHDGLRHLRVETCLVEKISVRCSQLETLSLKMNLLNQAELDCPLLRELNLGSCVNLSDASIRSIANSCPLLESLDISMIKDITDEALRGVASNCANLRTLNASGITRISLESMTFPALRVLKLDRCMGITPASMAAISCSRMLEDLEINNCSLLTSAALDLPCLKRIKVVHCRELADLNLRTHNQNLTLSSVMVSECPALRRVNVSTDSLQVCLLTRDQFLPAVLLSRVKLTQNLALQKQENVKTLVLQCESLQEVDVSDCESLTDSKSEVLRDGDGCPLLKSVVLNNCGTLTTARFRSASLESLSIAECQALTTLELACPRLPEVCLDGCHRLERASFCPVGFRSLNLGTYPKLSTLAIEAPEMDVLELKGCGDLSKASINCPVLTSLDASYCSQLNDESLAAVAASCPLIETLILMSCKSIGCNGLRSLHLLPRLTTLDLSYTFLTDLLPVFEACLQLKVLRLNACKYLTDSSLEPLYKQGALPSLRELDLSFGYFKQSAIEELLTCCTHLTHLNLNGCVNVRDLEWTCAPESGSPDTFQGDSLQVEQSNKQPERLLESLNCVGCPNIGKIFIRGPQWFHLSSLNFSLSQNLKEVDISCPNLSFLSLSNCSSLEILKLECPSLISLSLQNCNIDEETLEAVISRCRLVKNLDILFCPKMRSVSELTDAVREHGTVKDSVPQSEADLQQPPACLIKLIHFVERLCCIGS